MDLVHEFPPPINKRTGSLVCCQPLRSSFTTATPLRNPLERPKRNGGPCQNAHSASWHLDPFDNQFGLELILRAGGFVKGRISKARICCLYPTGEKPKPKSLSEET